MRRRLAERMGALGTDLLQPVRSNRTRLRRRMQFLPKGADTTELQHAEGKPLSDDDIEAMLADLGRAPLGVDREREFRISVAGAQEKTALLRMNGQMA